MIIIEKIEIEKNEKCTFLKARIQLGDTTVSAWKNATKLIDKRIAFRYKSSYLTDNHFDLWYSVDHKYEEILCTERCDAFVVALLYFAVLTGEDIKSSVPITDTLMYQLTFNIIPLLCENRIDPIKIIADTASSVESQEKAVGTGVSCGIDSFATIQMNMNIRPESYSLTHLSVFNTGSLNFDGYGEDVTLETWRDETLKQFDELIERGKKIADKLGLQFISVDSNISDVYQGAFLFSHTYRNCSAVLATQKLWNVYYYSSSGKPISLNVDVLKGVEAYDILLLPNLSTKKLTFYSAGVTYQRLKKTEMVSKNTLFHKYLNVCSYNSKINCGKCDKCMRTLVGLDVLNKKELFGSVFEDMNFYEYKKNRAFARILASKKSDCFDFEIKEYMKKRKMKFPFKSKVICMIRMIVIQLLKVVKR